MTNLSNHPAPSAKGFSQKASRIALVCLVAASIAGCRADHAGPQVAGWTLIDPAERHPILVSEQPVTMSLPVHRGAYGLSNNARRRAARFLARFRSMDAGNSKLVISAPSGGANEVAAMRVVGEIRQLAAEAGFQTSSIHVEAYRGSGNVRLSYLRIVAKAPECGQWTTNLANEPGNLSYPNFGCATQRNFAEMVANPADLLGPRTETPRSGTRRDQVWAKHAQGEVTAAKKAADEKVSTRKSE